MAKPEIIAGLDMGSGKVTCVLASHDPAAGKVRIISGASVPCKGLKGGVVVSIPETTKAVALAMEEAEEKGGEVIREVLMGVRGTHITTYNNRGAYNIARTDREITADDVASVIESAKAIPMSSDREILHVVPQGFSLDRQKGVPNPVGMEGSLLEVGVHIVTASSSHINNLMRAVSQAGFRVVDTVYSLLALGEVVVSPEEKDLGCLLIDVGDQSVSVGSYYEGSLRFSRELGIGGYHVTRDIAYALHTSMSAAQSIKEKHGAVLSSLVDDEGTISVVGLDGRNKREIKPRELLDYIQPRVEEIYGKVNAALQNCNYAFPGGAVLTGGGSLLRGMPEAAEQMLELQQSRLGLPRPDFIDGPPEYMTHEYTTAAALVCYPFIRSWPGDSGHAGPSAGGFVRRVKRLLQNMI
ncbi:MAG: cell division protein FtsA [Elusimicrobiota bacterium]|jgi:cell division protein FtsA